MHGWDVSEGCREHDLPGHCYRQHGPFWSRRWRGKLGFDFWSGDRLARLSAWRTKGIRRAEVTKASRTREGPYRAANVAGRCRRGHRIAVLAHIHLLHLLTAACGATRTSLDVRAMSAIEGISEVKYSLGVFRMLTLNGHPGSFRWCSKLREVAPIGRSRRDERQVKPLGLLASSVKYTGAYRKLSVVLVH
jgi:hypothetical protein